MDLYSEHYKRFQSLVRERKRDDTMVALIIDSPWLPGYAGENTLDFYFDVSTWLSVYERVQHDLPDVLFLPGAWQEYGMYAEPSGWPVKVHWSRLQPPGINAYPGDLAQLAAEPVPDPETEGLMPVILRQYERLREGDTLRHLGMQPKMAAARGPLAVASHLHGVTELLMATQLDPDNCQKLLDKTTELCIAWLKAQLDRMEAPFGILVLDDLVGMMSPDDAAKFAFPRLERIFSEFDGMIKVFHNDTPNEKVFPGLAGTGFDVFNFSHKTPLARARELVGPDIVLLGNLPPLELLVNGSPEDVRDATRKQLALLPGAGPFVVSPGGGVSPGTPIENLQAMVSVVKEHGS